MLDTINPKKNDQSGVLKLFKRNNKIWLNTIRLKVIPKIRLNRKLTLYFGSIFLN